MFGVESTSFCNLLDSGANHVPLFSARCQMKFQYLGEFDAISVSPNGGPSKGGTIVTVTVQFLSLRVDLFFRRVLVNNSN